MNSHRKNSAILWSFVLLLIIPLMRCQGLDASPFESYNEDGDIPPQMDPNLAAFSAINPKLRDLDNVSVTTDISLDSNDTALSDTGGGRYFTFFSSSSCITLTRGFYKSYMFYPGCMKIESRHGEFRCYACWFYIKIKNKCKRTPKAIYFNGCDKKNGFFRFWNPLHYLRVAKGPTLKYGDFASCAASYTYPIKPNSTFYITYLVDIQKNLDWKVYKNWSPFDTWLWGVLW